MVNRHSTYQVLTSIAITLCVIGIISLFVSGMSLFAVCVSAISDAVTPSSNNPGWTGYSQRQFKDGNGLLGGVHLGSAVASATIRDCQTACASVAGCNAVTLNRSAAANGTDINCMFDSYGPSVRFMKNDGVDTAMQNPPTSTTTTMGIIAGVSGAIGVLLIVGTIVGTTVGLKYRGTRVEPF